MGGKLILPEGCKFRIRIAQRFGKDLTGRPTTSHFNKEMGIAINEVQGHAFIASGSLVPELIPSCA